MNTPLDQAIQGQTLFTHWQDPHSGITSHLLRKQAAPCQQTFYYVNSGLSDDGHYLWFYCAFPPAGNANYGRCLGLADFANKAIRCFPETQFLDASPGIDPATSEVYWCNGVNIWKRGPGADDPVMLVNRLGDDLVRSRRPWRIATHLTISADKQALNFDAEIGNDWFVGDIPLNSTPMRLWQKFDRCYNHGQFHPTDPNLQLIAQDHAFNHSTGERMHIQNRLWLIRRDQPAYPVLPDSGSAMHGHEWWGANGERIWYIHYQTGVKYVELKNVKPDMARDPETTAAWHAPNVTHAHSDTQERYLVGDFLPPFEHESGIKFFHRASGKSVNIVSFMPYLPPSMTAYHIHPHPRFCLNDEYICYTTTVLGEVDVAFVRVKDLLAMVET